MARATLIVPICVFLLIAGLAGCGSNSTPSTSTQNPATSPLMPSSTPPATPPGTTTPPPAGASSFVFVANNGSTQHVGGSVSAFRIAGGTLVPVAGSPFATTAGPSAVGRDPAGHFVFVAEDGSVPGARGSNCTLQASMLVVGSVNPATGALTSADSKTLSAVCARAIAVDPAGKQVYVAMGQAAGSGGVIEGFAISPSGTLTELPGSPFTVTGFATGLAMHPSGRFLYAASNSGLLILDRDSATGALVERGAFNTPKLYLALNPAGTFLAATEANSNEISEFLVDPNTGDVAAMDFRAQAAGPVGIAVDFQGAFFAATETLDTTTLAGGVSTFTFNGTAHELDKTSGSPFPAGSGTIALAFDSSGTHLFAVNRQDGTVSIFMMDRSSGNLTAAGSMPTGGDFPDALVVVTPR